MSPQPAILAKSPRLLLIAAVIACGSDAPVAPGAAGASTLIAISPTSLEGEVGAAVDPLPTVRVTDKQGRPRAGVTVSFQTNDGVIAVSKVDTDADGVATPGEWVLGHRPGGQTLRALADGYEVSFSAVARAAAPAVVRLSWWGDEVVLPGEHEGRLLAYVTDRFRNSVSGVTVEFAVTEGDGRLGDATSRSETTDASGMAIGGEWILGVSLGRHSVQARVNGVEPASVSVLVADPGLITWFERTTRTTDGVTYHRHDLGFVDLDLCGAGAQQGYVIERGSYSYEWEGQSVPPQPLRQWGTYVIGTRVAGSAALTIIWAPRSLPFDYMEPMIRGTLSGASVEFSKAAGWPWANERFALPQRADCETDNDTGP